jgi:hypothetical protein
MLHNISTSLVGAAPIGAIGQWFGVGNHQEGSLPWVESQPWPTTIYEILPSEAFNVSGV